MTYFSAAGFGPGTITLQLGVIFRRFSKFHTYLRKVERTADRVFENRSRVGLNHLSHISDYVGQNNVFKRIFNGVWVKFVKVSH